MVLNPRHSKVCKKLNNDYTVSKENNACGFIKNLSTALKLVNFCHICLKC